MDCQRSTTPTEPLPSPSSAPAHTCSTSHSTLRDIKRRDLPFLQQTIKLAHHELTLRHAVAERMSTYLESQISKMKDNVNRQSEYFDTHIDRLKVLEKRYGNNLHPNLLCLTAVVNRTYTTLYKMTREARAEKARLVEEYENYVVETEFLEWSLNDKLTAYYAAGGF